MNILHISHPVSIPAKGYGGTERVVYSLAKMQAINGHNVFIMAGIPSNIPQVRDISFEQGEPYYGRKSIIKRIYTAYSLRALLKSRSFKYDIIHNHIFAEATYLSILAKSPIITTLHCPMTLRKFWPFINTSVSSLLPRKSKFVAISKRSFKLYQPFFGKDLLTCIQNGINVSTIPFNSKPQKDNEIQIASFGKIIPEKGAHIAIEIIDKINEWGYNVKLNIIGKLDYPLSNFADMILNMAKKRDYVEILPNMKTEKIYEILGNSDVLLNTSFEIGFNLSQLETLATGTPVVGFIDGGAEEVIVENYNGYLGKRTNDLAIGCLKAKDLNRKNCRIFVESNFNEEKMYKRYMQIYKLFKNKS